MKRCRICKINKQLSDFHKSKRHSLGVKNECANCTNEYLRSRYKNRGGRTKQEKIQQSSHHLQRKYGINIKDYDLLYKAQNGLCAICYKSQKSLYNTRISKGKKEILVVDHDHLNNRIRGLLCQNCNQAIGLFEENCNTLANAIEYLATR